jgi:hypothetical protein
MSNERIEPTRERVEAYEKALGCKRLAGAPVDTCWHGLPFSDLGCPVAVAAARVEADEVARLTATLDRVRAWLAEQPPVFPDLIQAIDGPADV